MIRRAIAGLFIVISLCFSLSGCVWMLLGAGAAGGYAVSKDSIAGEIDADYDTIWNAAERVSEIMGTIKNKDRTKGIIDLDVDKSKVSIRIERLTLETLRLRVAARKYKNLVPDPGLAQKIYVKINQQIE